MGDVIAAIATGNVRSAIGIIRVSGEGCLELVSRLFSPAGGGGFQELPPGRLAYGRLTDGAGALIDMCMCVPFRSPHSYTGEDSAEIHCHGSPVVLSLALEGLFSLGARQALPGEFTKRAFLNGKLDLTGAEAVIDLIDAQTREAAVNASAQLGGAVTRRTERVYDSLLDMASHFDAVVDYPDEDIEDFRLEEYRDTLIGASRDLGQLLDTFQRGRIVKEGVLCAIAGRPNVGKSSLMNALLGYERAIVTSEPGTTRDTLEERAVLGGVLTRLVDTAGLREADSQAERLGVERAREASQGAQLVLAVLDGSSELLPEDGDTLEILKKAPRAIAVINKTDLPQKLDRAALSGFDGPVIEMSAKEGRGIDELERAVGDMFRGEPVPAGEMITNARQAGEIRRALEALDSAAGALDGGWTPDAVLTMVEEAMDALASLSGRKARQDVTDRIFERFCVGK